jgi:hypothetical protein
MILLAEAISLNFFFRGEITMPLHGLPFRLGLKVMNPCLITHDHGGQEIVTLSLITRKELQADDFSLFLMLFS